MQVYLAARLLINGKIQLFKPGGLENMKSYIEDQRGTKETMANMGRRTEGPILGLIIGGKA